MPTQEGICTIRYNEECLEFDVYVPKLGGFAYAPMKKRIARSVIENECKEYFEEVDEIAKGIAAPGCSLPEILEMVVAKSSDLCDKIIAGFGVKEFQLKMAIKGSPLGVGIDGVVTGDFRAQAELAAGSSTFSRAFLRNRIAATVAPSDP